LTISFRYVINISVTLKQIQLYSGPRGGTGRLHQKLRSLKTHGLRWVWLEGPN